MEAVGLSYFSPLFSYQEHVVLINEIPLAPIMARRVDRSVLAFMARGLCWVMHKNILS